MTNRETWGPHMWYTIHFIALGYPIDASSIDKKNYKNFYINLPNIIPCDECAKHLVNNLNNFSIDNYLESRDKLFEWTIILHNQVNKMLGKKEWNLDIAKKYYLNFNIKLEETNKCFNKSYIIIIILLTIILYLLLRNKNMFKNL
jgi:hypothetical protein